MVFDGTNFHLMSPCAQLHIRYASAQTTQEKLDVAIRAVQSPNLKQNEWSIMMEIIRTHLATGEFNEALSQSSVWLFRSLASPPLVQLLLAHGANPNATFGQVNSTLLHEIASRLSRSDSTNDTIVASCYLISARLLVAKGADLHACDADGKDIFAAFNTDCEGIHNLEKLRNVLTSDAEKLKKLFNYLPESYADTTTIPLTDKDKQDIKEYNIAKYAKNRLFTGQPMGRISPLPDFQQFLRG